LNRKKENNKWQLRVLIGIIILVISFGIYSSIKDKNDLKNYSENTIGIITKIEHRTSRGYFIEYNYIVNNKRFIGTQKLTIEKESLKLKDKFNVIYYPKNPENSRLQLEKPITK